MFGLIYQVDSQKLYIYIYIEYINVQGILDLRFSFSLFQMEGNYNIWISNIIFGKNIDQKIMDNKLY